MGLMSVIGIMMEWAAVARSWWSRGRDGHGVRGGHGVHDGHGRSAGVGDGAMCSVSLAALNLIFFLATLRFCETKDC